MTTDAPPIPDLRETHSPAHAIGLLVVHGIGSQTRGGTARGLVKGLTAAYGGSIVARRIGDDHTVLDGFPYPVHVIEVYWADLLHGEAVAGTFDFERVFELVWYPGLNVRSGALTPEYCPPGRVRMWTWTLRIASPVLSLAAFAARTLSEPFSFAGAKNDVDAPRGDRSRARFDVMMDEVAGDVFNYVDGARGSFRVMNDRTRVIAKNVPEIRDRFAAAAQRAVDAGCDEIQVVGHSLGSVIAFTSLSSAAGDDRAPATARLSRVYTIGSPLEKFRFFWTRLLDHPPGAPGISRDATELASSRRGDDDRGLSWDNFYSPVDLVSGRLQGFPGWPPPRNHAVPSLGGMLSSHVSYDNNPTFLAALGQGLGGALPSTRKSLWRRLLRGALSIGQNILLPVAIIVLFVIGFLLTAAVGLVAGRLLGLAVSPFGLDGLARAIEWFVVLAALAGVTVFAVLKGRSDAHASHARFWAGAQGPVASEDGIAPGTGG